MNWQTLELLTPCYCSGAHQSRPEIRTASIRGQLHFWARLLHAEADPLRHEMGLLGGLRGRAMGRGEEPVASALVLRVIPPPQEDLAAAPDEGPWPWDWFICGHDRGKGTRQHFRAGAQFHLGWELRAGLAAVAAEGADQQQQSTRLLKAWMLMGGLGLRSNRAAGSVWPLSYQPAISDFEALVGQWLPAAVSCRVLADLKPEDLTRSYPGRASDAERLRAVACDTVNHDGLGFARRDRKASPLKLKVGHFAEGYRLIAVWDNRHDRGSQLPGAVSELERYRKLLGQALRAVGIG